MSSLRLVIVGVTIAALIVTSCTEDAAGLPDHYVGDGQSCGEFEYPNAPPPPPDLSPGVDCLQAGRAAGEEAYLSVIVWTVEGHPTRDGFQLTADGTFVVETDWNDDPLGPDGIEVRDCSDLTLGQYGYVELSGCEDSE